VNKNSEPFLSKTNCPLCQNSIIITWQPDNIPFFGNVMYTCSQCDCGFRYADTMILTQREPMRFTLGVESPKDLNIRVIRSVSGTIRIPELGINIEPGYASESYVSNVEGVLCRIEDVVRMVTRWVEEPLKSIERAHEILESLRQVRLGERCITIIIEDPLGNSAIISDKAKSEVMIPEEAEGLKTGFIVLEKDDLPDHLYQ
jgi:zinc finger protein